MPNKPGFDNVLEAVADQNRPAGAPTQDIPLHANNMRRLARAGAPIFGETLTSAGLQTAGFANEAMDALRGLPGIVQGGLPSLTGSNAAAGFDQSDLVSNKVGIDQGLADARADKAAQQPEQNANEEERAAEDSKVARRGVDPVSRRKALFNRLNGKHEIEGSDGGLQGVLAALGGS